MLVITLSSFGWLERRPDPEDLRGRVLLLTGDHPGAAERVARETGITAVEADLRPQDKLARVHALASQGAIVAMVGDGVNDAAALAAAHVSVAMGGGTQIAAASAGFPASSDSV